MYYSFLVRYLEFLDEYKYINMINNENLILFGFENVKNVFYFIYIYLNISRIYKCCLSYFGKINGIEFKVCFM